MKFHDRIDAGKKLAHKLLKFKNEPGIVMAVPRGGVPVAYVIARELGFPIEVILTKKIGHPLNKEYAIGAASLSDYFVIPHANVGQEYIDHELIRIRERLKEMQKRFMGDQTPQNLKGKTVLIIDDGIATGNTISGTVNVLKKSQPGKIIIAVPVSSTSAFQKLQKEVDEIIAVTVSSNFYGVGSFYENFNEVSDEEVIFYLDKLRDLRKAG